MIGSLKITGKAFEVTAKAEHATIADSALCSNFKSFASSFAWTNHAEIWYVAFGWYKEWKNECFLWSVYYICYPLGIVSTIRINTHV